MATAIKFNRNKYHNWLAIACENTKLVEIIDIEKQKSILCMSGINKNIRDVSWYFNDPYLAVGCEDKHLHIFDPRQNSKHLFLSLSSHEAPVTSVDWAPNAHVASVSMDKTVKLWNIKVDVKQKQCITYKHHEDQAWCVRFNSSQNRLATVGDDGYLCVYSVHLK